MAKVKQKAAEESLSLFNRGLETLITTAQKALNSGVSKKAVKAATSPVRGAKATVGAIKKADEKLIDLITRQKRSKTGQEYTTGTTTGAARFQKKGENTVKRGTARAVVYGGAATAGGVGVKKQMDKAANKAAEKLKKEEEAKERAAAKKRANDQIDGFTAALGKREEEAAKRAAEKAASGKTGKKERRLKGKFLPGIRPFGGKIAKVLLGKDEQFGGEAGLIDPDLGLGIRRKSMGGMMKSKGSAKGGKMGGKMMPGYKKGGAVKKVSKGSSRGGKRRGVGAAKRGFGKALR